MKKKKKELGRGGVPLGEALNSADDCIGSEDADAEVLTNSLEVPDLQSLHS